MQKVEDSTAIITLTPEALSTRMGISAKRVRQILRADCPRDVRKRRRWEIPETLARKLQRDYRAKLKEKEAKKQVEIENQLKSEE